MDEVSPESLKEFAFSFFKYIGAQLEANGNSIIVKNAPKEFESFFGKSAPYYLAFNPSEENENTELISKGSFMLKAMHEYLENTGQAMLLKINFPSPEEKTKNKFILKNCSVLNSSKKEKLSFITRFTFSTILQYLNEKEQLTNSLYLKDKKAIEFNEEKYNIADGNIKEAPQLKLKEEYIIAKELLKAKIFSRLEEVQGILKQKLKKELERLDKHRSQQIFELEQELERQNLQLKKAEEESRKNPNLREKITRLKNSIKSFRLQEKKERINKEYNFLIKDESYKHSLNLSNKLLNTAIIYYPRYIFNFQLANGKIRTKIIELEYDPFYDVISPISCESCNKQIISLSVCAGGHISCPACLKECKNCRNKVCKHCKTRVCSICARDMCHACTAKCPSCSNYICAKHLKKERFSGKELCTSCLSLCPGCSSHIKKSDLKPCPACSKKFCSSCIRPFFLNNRIIHRCPDCAKKKNI